MKRVLLTATVLALLSMPMLQSCGEKDEPAKKKAPVKEKPVKEKPATEKPEED